MRILILELMKLLILWMMKTLPSLFKQKTYNHKNHNKHNYNNNKNNLNKNEIAVSPPTVDNSQ